MIQCIFNFTALYSNFQPSKSAIKIGRGRDCEILVSDPSVSKVHCTIQYDNIVGWTIRDGFNSKKNPTRTSEVFVASLNGTWLFLKENSVIVDGMVIQSGSTTFQCFLEEK
jgi:pSer/pThr/pTyr-binding forkhead associated (FHA) protein